MISFLFLFLFYFYFLFSCVYDISISHTFSCASSLYCVLGGYNYYQQYTCSIFSVLTSWNRWCNHYETFSITLQSHKIFRTSHIIMLEKNYYYRKIQYHKQLFAIYCISRKIVCSPYQNKNKYFFVNRTAMEQFIKAYSNYVEIEILLVLHSL